MRFLLELSARSQNPGSITSPVLPCLAPPKMPVWEDCEKNGLSPSAIWRIVVWPNRGDDETRRWQRERAVQAAASPAARVAIARVGRATAADAAKGTPEAGRQAITADLLVAHGATRPRDADLWVEQPVRRIGVG